MGRRSLFGVGGGRSKKEKEKKENKKNNLVNKFSEEISFGKKKEKKEPEEKMDKLRMRERAKQKSENNRSLRKIKKRDVVKQMLQKFPKENKGNNIKPPKSSSYDLSAIEAVDSDEDPEASYASRKLLIRQMQGMIAKGVHGDQEGSEYDSWTDLEENFARAYEPIPLDIHIDTWRKMSKKDIIKTVRSRKMRKDFEDMSRSEILSRIEKMQKSAKYLSAKFGVEHLLPQLDIVAQVHRSEEDSDDGASELTNFSKNVPEYLSRTEILNHYEPKGTKSASPQERKRPVQVASNGLRRHDSWSSRASSILNNPDSIYVSRGEVLKNLQHGHSKPGPPQKMMPPSEPRLPVRVHDSWSSRASSILANHAAAASMVEQNQHSRPPVDPHYMSRAELIDKLADLAYDTLSNQSCTEGEEEEECSYNSMESSSSQSDSDASTVKNVVLTSKISMDSQQRQRHHEEPRHNVVRHHEQSRHHANQRHHEESRHQRQRLEEPLHHKRQDQKGAKAPVKHKPPDPKPEPPSKVKSALSNNFLGLKRFALKSFNQSFSQDNNDNTHQRGEEQNRKNSNKFHQAMVEQMNSQSESERGLNNGDTVANHESEYSLASEDPYDDNYDTCSCTSCETYSDCSCSQCGEDNQGDFDDEEAEEHHYSFTSSSATSVATVVEGDGERERGISGRDKGSQQDLRSELSAKQYSAPSSKGSSFKGKARASPFESSSRSSKMSQVREELPLVVERASSVESVRTKLVRKESTSAKERIQKWEMKKDVWNTEEPNEIYEPVNAKEIQRQKNARVLKKQIREIASDWDSKINDLNTLRRGRVLKELKKFLREKIDFDQPVQPEEINRQVEVLLRQALDSNFEALSNLNIGQMYIPMEDSMVIHPKPVSRENTDYDTFGSIDSLIFEPKVGRSKKDIREAQEAIDKQFQYLNLEDGGEDSQDDVTHKVIKPKKKFFAGPGKTTFAERVRLFQNLGKKDIKAPQLPNKPSKKITFLDVRGPDTSWKQLAAQGKEEKAQEEEEEVFCPDCQNPYDFSLNSCSNCDYCMLNYSEDNRAQTEEEVLKEDLKPDNEQPMTGDTCYNLSSATTSWNYLNSDKKEEDEVVEEEEESMHSSLSCDSVINNFMVAPSPGGAKPVTNLRLQLKEAFGSRPHAESAQRLDVYDEINDISLKTDCSADTLVGKSEELETVPVGFLAEYAVRKSLYDEEATEQPAVLVREGETVQLTEEMFRGELKGTLKKMAVNTDMASNEDSKKKQGSEMGDSGIASPPGAPSLCQIASKLPEVEDEIEEEEEEEEQGDSGVEESDKKLPLPGMKKRDTMIRELKSKLKEKFHVESTSSSENNSMNPADHPDQLAPGTVVSRRETMGPKLSKLFGNKMKQRKAEEIAAASFAMAKKMPVPVLPTSPTLKIPPPPPMIAEMVAKSKVTNNVSRPSKAASEAKVEAKSPTGKTSPEKPPSVTSFKALYHNKNKHGSGNSSGSEDKKSSPDDSSVYDPSLPEELKKSVPAGILFRGNRPFTPPGKGDEGARKKDKAAPLHTVIPSANSCSGCGGQRCQEAEEDISKLASANPADRREFLYGPGGIFGPKGPFSTPAVRYPHGLEVPVSNGKRNVHFDRKVGNSGNANMVSISDASSAVAEDRSCKSHYVVNSVLDASEMAASAAAAAATAAASKPAASRMETYRAEWADQECSVSKVSKPLVPQDLERWREEKARRMVAWINSSQLTGYWGAETPWWKVGGGEESFFDSLNVGGANEGEGLRAPNNTPIMSEKDA